MRPVTITTLEAQEGQSISVVGDTYRILLSGQQTKGTYTIIDMLIPPQGGPGPHAHAAIQESFYVVEGQIEFQSESQTYTASQGSFVDIPLGGAVHSFKNKTDQLAHLLCVVVPAGLDGFFTEIGEPVESGTFLAPPTMTPAKQQQVEEIAKRYGQELFPPDYFNR